MIEEVIALFTLQVAYDMDEVDTAPAKVKQQRVFIFEKSERCKNKQILPSGQLKVIHEHPSLALIAFSIIYAVSLTNSSFSNKGKSSVLKKFRNPS